MRRGPKPAKSKVESKPPVASKSAKSDDAQVSDLEKRLTEALEQLQTRDRELAEAREQLTAAAAQVSESREQQTATAEILRVISSSPTDIQPVLDAVAESAARLCDSFDAAIWRRDGDRFLLVAHHGTIPIGPVGEFTIPLVRGTAAGRAVLEGRTVHVADIQTEADEFPESSENARHMGHRAILCVPLMRKGVAIGAISILRTEARLFTDRQVALLQTFADQAVIAIENVRLFTEIKEALDQQTATAEVLRVISKSPTDVQPVLDAIAASAARVCGADDALIIRVADGISHAVAHFGKLPLSPGVEGRPVTRRFVVGRAILERRTIHVADVDEVRDEYPDSIRAYRTFLVAPLVQESIALGAIVMRRRERKPFSDQQVTLLETFADQAVIAIENVRLFEELEASNRELTESLEQQTATSEVLKVISRSTFDLQPVLDTLIENAARLCGARRGVILRLDGDAYHGVAFYNASPELIDFIKRHPVTPGRHTITARVALERRTIHVADIQADPEYRYALRDIDPIRTELGVPMFRGDDLLGVLILYKLEVQPFSDKQIELVTTFADQAVIAIENVRLFKELEARNRDLTEALEQQTVTAEILRIISSSPTDVQPVFDAIAAAATTLCAAENAGVFLFDGTLIHFAAHHRWTAKDLDAIRQAFPLKVHVIVTVGGAATKAAKQVTATIPIVMSLVTEPVPSGLVSSLARPGGNVTGTSMMASDLAGKQFEMLKQAVPKASRVALLWNPANPGGAAQLREAKTAARALGLRLQALEARAPQEIDSAFAAMTRERADALVVLGDAILYNQRKQIAELAAKSRLPSASALREYAEAGGLIAYGTDSLDLERRSTAFVDKILKGAKPADLPVEQPTKFELVINLKTAKALGLTIPQSILVRADEVIQ